MTGEHEDGPGRLLTFRLDREVRQRLRSKLAGEGRTLTEVVTAGLRRYVERRLRAAAHAAAGWDGTSLSQVIDQIVHRYLRHGPSGEVELGDTTPTGPGLRSARDSGRARRRTRRGRSAG